MNAPEFLKAKGVWERSIELPSGKDMKLAELLEEYASQYAHQQPVNDGWVRVDDVLPKEYEHKPTHWRPLPEPPKQTV